jgi:hypothetical protein
MSPLGSYPAIEGTETAPIPCPDSAYRRTSEDKALKSDMLGNL